MKRRMNNKSKVVKAVSIALSVYMALSPVVLHADEMADAENDVAEQVEAVQEAAECVAEAVENAAVSEPQAEFESVVADVNVSDITPENTLANTSELIENQIKSIENEAIREAADVIVNVDMSNVNDALNTVTELVDQTVTDEVVAGEIEATADTLITIYDTQATAALEALKVISEEAAAVTVLEDGSVSVDWNAATQEVQDLYNKYQEALKAKNDAESTKDKAAQKQNAASEKVDELNSGVINNNKDINEKVSESKLNKDKDINKCIDEIVANNGRPFVEKDSIDRSVEGSNDVYRFFVNVVENGIVYGCLTYYDSENMIILRKNFSISADGKVDYDYVPDSKWVKNDANCVNGLFGNGGNYIAAYVGKGNDKNYYMPGNAFNGTRVSDVMRANVNLNEAIDARNEALDEIKELAEKIEEFEKNIQKASEDAEAALSRYREAVAMYKNVASLEAEIKKDEIEIAMLEYVKAEVKVFRKQQVLNQIKEAIDNSNADDADENGADNTEAQENIEAVITGIASTLGVEVETVESMVAQTMIETEGSYTVETLYGEVAAAEAAVAGVRREIEETKEAEEIESAKVVEQKESVDNDQELVTIVDEEVPLANFAVETNYRANWMLPLIIMSMLAACVLFIVIKNNKKEEEANI